MDVQVREARIDDAEGAAAVYVSSAVHHYRLDPNFYRVPEMPAVVAQYRERIANRQTDSMLFVAVSDSRVIGMALTDLMPEPSAASMVRPRRVAGIDVAVLPEFRSQGVGQALMGGAERWARERGADLALLDCHVSNDDAIRFYTQRLMYERTGLLLRKGLDGPTS